MMAGTWLAVGLVVLIGAALTLAVIRWLGSVRPAASRSGAAAAAPDSSSEETEHAHRPLVAFVVNPTKPGIPSLREAAVWACAGQDLPAPLWFETTPEDPGRGQSRDAVRRGANLVVAVGGDGTVRGVAEGVAGSGIPMGVVPIGTGNLFARNVDIPLGNAEKALAVALSGRDRAVDIAWLEIERADGVIDESEHLFLVIAGLGFDARMVAGTDENLKKWVGWLAYFFSGVRHLHGPRMHVTMEVDERASRPLKLRSLLIGNCGKLPGGLTLLPDALVDDGWLDVAAIDTRGGILGWGQLFGEVVLQGFGVRSQLRARVGRMDHVRGRQVVARVDHPVHVQVDGDVLGKASRVRARVDPGALILRVPDVDDARDWDRPGVRA
jgi:diacylglycerol kinase family enzyme